MHHGTCLTAIPEASRLRGSVLRMSQAPLPATSGICLLQRLHVFKELILSPRHGPHATGTLHARHRQASPAWIAVPMTAWLRRFRRTRRSCVAGLPRGLVVLVLVKDLSRGAERPAACSQCRRRPLALCRRLPSRAPPGSCWVWTRRAAGFCHAACVAR